MCSLGVTPPPADVLIDPLAIEVCSVQPAPSYRGLYNQLFTFNLKQLAQTLYRYVRVWWWRLHHLEARGLVARIKTDPIRIKSSSTTVDVSARITFSMSILVPVLSGLAQAVRAVWSTSTSAQSWRAGAGASADPASGNIAKRAFDSMKRWMSGIVSKARTVNNAFQEQFAREFARAVSRKLLYLRVDAVWDQGRAAATAKQASRKPPASGSSRIDTIDKASGSGVDYTPHRMPLFKLVPSATDNMVVIDSDSVFGADQDAASAISSGSDAARLFELLESVPVVAQDAFAAERRSIEALQPRLPLPTAGGTAGLPAIELDLLKKRTRDVDKLLRALKMSLER